eukprot:GHRR01035184.1.p3 GENE.GHRR01035184.1~~GHRR01035184.1.p3  ORF type:complete len:112 (+),score=37.98 GHRR01035184.1:299-634(+)
MLSVRQPKDGQGKDKTYIMFRTEGGKQLAYSPLMTSSSVMNFPNSHKKCRVSLMVLEYKLPSKQDGQTTDQAAAAAPGQPTYKLQVCMITLGSPEKVSEFSQVVDQHKPKS